MFGYLLERHTQTWWEEYKKKERNKREERLQTNKRKREWGIELWKRDVRENLESR